MEKKICRNSVFFSWFKIVKLDILSSGDVHKKLDQAKREKRNMIFFFLNWKKNSSLFKYPERGIRVKFESNLLEKWVVFFYDWLNLRTKKKY